MNELFGLDVTECINNNFKVVQSGPFKNQILSLDVKSTEDYGIFLEAVTDSITPFESNLKPGQPIEEVHDISIQDTLGRVIHIKDVYIAKSSWELDHNGHKTRSNVKFSSICRDVEDVNNVYCTIETVSNLENVFNRGPSHLTAFQRKTITTNNISVGRNFTFSNEATSKASARNVLDFNVGGHNVSIYFADKLGNGFVLFEGFVKPDYIHKVLDVISFLMGRKIESVATKFVDSNGAQLGYKALPKLKSVKSVKSYITSTPIPLNKINSSAVCALFDNYDTYNLRPVLWSYFQALDASIEKKAVYYGGCIEAFQKSYMTINKQKISRSLIEKSTFRQLRKDLLAVLDNTTMDEDLKRSFQNKIDGLNVISQNMVTQKFFAALGLDVRDLETTAWNRRNDAAHGNVIPSEEYVDLFRHNTVLHCLFNRMILASFDISTQYVDYYTYGFPTRHISSCIPASD